MLTEAMQYIAGLCEQNAEQDFSSLGNATLRTQGAKMINDTTDTAGVA